MTFKIDEVSYPNLGKPMLRHRTLGPILCCVLRPKMYQENCMFLDAVEKGKSYSSLYNVFVDAPKARHMIDISGSVRAPMEQFGKMGNFCDKQVWKAGIKAAVI